MFTVQLIICIGRLIYDAYMGHKAAKYAATRNERAREGFIYLLNLAEEIDQNRKKQELAQQAQAVVTD